MNSKTQTLLEAAHSDANSSISFAQRTFAIQHQADAAFAGLKKKLLDINEWNRNSALSTYQLFDEAGVPQNSCVVEGVFNRISLKGSGKYDWVRVFEIKESTDELVIRVQPTYDPTAENPDPSNISHFFTSESNNNFCLRKHEMSVALYVIGLNEKQNTGQTKNSLETLRNIAAANLGSYLGIQKGEWEKFCQSFIDKAPG